ncbi:hypothetical protein XFF6992_80065 [Xanthomonas citri pv. fuscans]|nr:hypothetical protein XFF6992_80065 [Xanthomonas citri pv. fuscans]
MFQKLGRGWQFADPSGPLVWTWPEPTRFIRPVFDPSYWLGSRGNKSKQREIPCLPLAS